MSDPVPVSVLYVRGFPEDLRRKLKAYAALQRKSLSDAVTELLGEAVTTALVTASGGTVPIPQDTSTFPVPLLLKIGHISDGEPGSPAPPATNFWTTALGRPAVWISQPDGLGLVHIAGIGWVEGVLPSRFIGQSLAEIMDERSLIRRLINEAHEEGTRHGD